MRWCRSTARAAAATGDRRPRPNRIANFAIANADFASAAKPRKHDEGGAGHRHLSQNTEYRSRPLPLPVGRLLFPCSALCAGPKLLRCTKTSKTHRCCRNRLVREISSKPFGIPYGRWLRERVNRAGAQVSNDGNGSEVTISGRSANGQLQQHYLRVRTRAPMGYASNASNRNGTAFAVRVRLNRGAGDRLIGAIPHFLRFRHRSMSSWWYPLCGYFRAA